MTKLRSLQHGYTSNTKFCYLTGKEEELFASGELSIYTTYWQCFKSSTRNLLNLVYVTASSANSTGMVEEFSGGVESYFWYNPYTSSECNLLEKYFS